MAIIDHIITSSDISRVNVIAQPTVLRDTPQNNKAVFDAYPRMIADHFNAALYEIANDTSAEIDREVLEYYEEIGWIPDND